MLLLDNETALDFKIPEIMIVVTGLFAFCTVIYALI